MLVKRVVDVKVERLTDEWIAEKHTIYSFSQQSFHYLTVRYLEVQWLNIFLSYFL